MAEIAKVLRLKNWQRFLEENKQTLQRWAKVQKCEVDNLIVTISIKPPFRHRTTGYKSQNHCLNGIIQIICEYTGQDFQSTKEYIKSIAVDRGYPILTRKILKNGELIEENVTDWYGNPRGISESDSSVEECSILIESALQVASELGINVPMC